MSNLSVKDGNGVIKTLAALLNGVGDLILHHALVDGSTGANFAAVTAAGALSVDPTPSAVAPVKSTAPEASRVLKASAGALLSLTTIIGATNGWLLLFDATSAPADGAVTPAYVFPIDGDGTKGVLSLEWAVPLKFATGITAVFSSTGPFSKTASVTAAFFGQVR